MIKRSLCHNDDEMVTGEAKTDIHPFDYFSIEDDGKVWWFHQKSMIQWAQKSVVVTNPFTRNKLSRTDMNRLHELIFLRKKSNQPIVHSYEVEHPNIEYLCYQRWLRIVQKMREYDFAEDIHPNHFNSLDYDQCIIFVNSLIEYTRFWKNSDEIKSKQGMIFSALRRYRTVMTIHVNLTTISHDIAGLLILGLFEIKETLDFVVMILNAATKSGVLVADL